MFELPDIPDPSATEAPQRFGSNAKSELGDRVLDALERELGPDQSEFPTDFGDDAPDRVVQPAPPVADAPALWTIAVAMFVIGGLLGLLVAGLVAIVAVTGVIAILLG